MEPSDILDAMGASVFRFADGRFAWDGNLGLPTGRAAFDLALGAQSQMRAQTILADPHYSVRYTVGTRVLEETGHRAPDGTLSGIVRVVDTVREGWEPLSQDTILGAVNARRVALAFQPVVDARDRTVHHHECLLRMTDADGQTLPAGRVIESAEALGLVAILDRRALELAARELIGTHVRLSLNVSAQTVADRYHADGYLSALRALGPAAGRLTIELTETVAVADPAEAARFATQARALGCRFSIDDFGSGYTSFRNLLAIEADEIKIDGDFVDGLLGSRRAQTFVRMMVDLAATFGVATVAERVETDAVADMLAGFGVDRLQGYRFGRPAMTLARVAS